MPWAGICKKCDYVCIAGRLRGIKEMFKEHYLEQHSSLKLNLPNNMDSMNREVFIDVSPNLSGCFWKSRQYEDNNIWVGVIMGSTYESLSKIMDKDDSNDEFIEYIKTKYWWKKYV